MSEICITEQVKRRFRNKSDWTHNEDDKDVRDFEIEADDLVCLTRVCADA